MPSCVHAPLWCDFVVPPIQRGRLFPHPWVWWPCELFWPIKFRNSAVQLLRLAQKSLLELLLLSSCWSECQLGETLENYLTSILQRMRSHMEENRDIPADSQQARHMSGANLKLLVPIRPSDICRLMSDPRQDQKKFPGNTDLSCCFRLVRLTVGWICSKYIYNRKTSNIYK